MAPDFVLKPVVTAASRQRVRRSRLGDYSLCTVWAVSHGRKETHAENTEEEEHIDARTILS